MILKNVSEESGERREPMEASRAALADAVLAMLHSNSLELTRNAKSLVLPRPEFQSAFKQDSG